MSVAVGFQRNRLQPVANVQLNDVYGEVTLQYVLNGWEKNTNWSPFPSACVYIKEVAMQTRLRLRPTYSYNDTLL